jgi:hypothetical protein
VSGPVHARTGLLQRLYRRLGSMLSAPAADRIILWFAFACLLVSLDTGLAADDYLFTVMLDRPSPIPGFARPPLDIFRFCDPRFSPALIEQGILMWWDDPTSRVAFFRPLTALSHWLDHGLFRNIGALQHLHSALWSLWLLVGVRALYRELFPERGLATLAFALYALDDARGWLVSWVAARNAPIATAFSVWALWLHLRQRRGQLPSGAWFGPLAFGLGLLASEGAVATAGYLIAYSFIVERGGLLRRLAPLWPYALVFVAWRVAYRALDYGVSGSSLYVDPWLDPLRFLRALVEKAPILLGSQLGGMWSDGWIPLFFAPRLQLAIYVATLGLIALVVRALWPRVRADARLAWLAGGTLASLVVASPAFLADRLLTWVGLGASALSASLLAPSLFAARPAALGGAFAEDPAMRPAPRALIAFLVVSHLIVGVMFMPSRARGTQVMRNFIDRVDHYVPRDASVNEQTLIFVNPPHIPFSAYPPLERAAQGLPRPRLLHTLATSTSELGLTRLDPHTLRIEPQGGYLQNPSSRMLWTERRAFRAGEQLRQGDMLVTVRAITRDARPLVVDARFEQPLEHPRYLWRQWRGTHAQAFEPPAVGARVMLPAADYIQAMLGITLPIRARL